MQVYASADLHADLCQSQGVIVRPHVHPFPNKRFTTTSVWAAETLWIVS